MFTVFRFEQLRNMFVHPIESPPSVTVIEVKFGMLTCSRDVQQHSIAPIPAATLRLSRFTLTSEVQPWNAFSNAS